MPSPPTMSELPLKEPEQPFVSPAPTPVAEPTLPSVEPSVSAPVPTPDPSAPSLTVGSSTVPLQSTVIESIPSPPVGMPINKPLLNPLQTSDPPPSSTIAEPPHSPNALDTTTLVSAPSTASATPAPSSSLPPPDLPTSLPVLSSAIPVIPEPELAINQPTPSLPPLPTDAPLPPAPDAADEPPPSLPPSAIPTAVPTPTVISIESEPPASSRPMLESIPVDNKIIQTSATDPEVSVPEPISESFPTPAGVSFDPIADATSAALPVVDPVTAPGTTPVPEAPPAAALQATPAGAIQEAPDAMDIDADGEGEDESSALALATSNSTGSLKRAGDDLEAVDAKRVREEAGSSAPAPFPPVTPSVAPVSVEPPASSSSQTVDVAAPIPALLPSDAVSSETAVAPSSAPAPVTDPSLIPLPPRPLTETGEPIPFPWEVYVQSTPLDPGPTTPLTSAQHKHLLNALRGLKKSPSAAAFQGPVDVVMFNIPHYPRIIPRQMDLGLIEVKLVSSDPKGPPKDKSRMGKWDPSKGTYANVAEVTADVRQIFENTRKFNGREHVVSKAADELEKLWEKALHSLPNETVAGPVTPGAVASPAGPSSVRRASISQVPAARRSPDSTRPKREIHPPAIRDIGYDGPRKPKRRNDPQLAWAAKQLISVEKGPKTYELVAPFLYPIGKIIEGIPEYANAIAKPIDLLMIRQRLEENAYEDIAGLNADLNLMTSNAKSFNPPGDAVHIAAMQFEQWWNEKLGSCPAKQEPREESEDPIAEDLVEESEAEDEDVVRLRAAIEEREVLNREIAELEARIAGKPGPTKRKSKSAGAGGARASKASATGNASGPSRKYSTSKASPGATATNGNGHASAPKKPRKSKDAAVAAAAATAVENEDESDIEPPPAVIVSVAQKQELADKIQTVDMSVLQEAISIIQSSTGLGGGGDEIELDMETLPPDVVLKLYNLVCRGIKGGGNGRGRKGSKSKNAGASGNGGGGAGGASGGAGRQHKKSKSGVGAGHGGPTRKHYNEKEEQERIRKMEEQLNRFDSGRQQQQLSGSYGAEEYSSSEEESSDEE